MAANTESGSKRQTGFFSTPVLASLAVLIIAVLAVGGYLMLQPSGQPSGSPRQSSSSGGEVLEGSAMLAPSVTPTPRLTNTPLPFPTLRPTATEVPIDTRIPTDTPAPTDTALPTATPAPTNTAAPIDVPANTNNAPANNPPAAKPTTKPAPASGGTQANNEPGIPVRLRIPTIGVNAIVEKVGVATDGTMGVPVDEWNVGWYKRGYRPGMVGNAAIDGHLNWTNGPAVFWNLAKLNPGDAIYVKDDKGVERKFIVNSLVTYPYNNAPLDNIFGAANTARLNLITCNGTYSKAARNYNKRLVVYTTLDGIVGNQLQVVNYKLIEPRPLLQGRGVLLA